MSPFSRRNFIQAGTGAALTSMIPGRHFTLAAEQTATTQPAGDRVRFASIGVGIQGSSLLRAAVTLPQCQCVAACDLYDGRHMLAQEIAGPDVRTTRRYQEILDDKNIQAVIVAVPDHWHKQITVDAIAAGKDVYCEKPMSHSIADGEAMVRAPTVSCVVRWISRSVKAPSMVRPRPTDGGCPRWSRGPRHAVAAAPGGEQP